MVGLFLVPVGYKFHPTDEELVHHYLRLKINGYDIAVSFIQEVDVCKKEPWDLLDFSLIEPIGDELFFFCPKYRNRQRLIRATIAGYWKTSGKEKRIKSSKRNCVIGKKKTFVFYIGRAPKGERTNWVIHEYCGTENELDCTHPGQSPFVLCRLFKKDNEKDETTQCSKFIYDQNASVIKSSTVDPPLEPLTPFLAPVIEDHDVERVDYMDFQASNFDISQSEYPMQDEGYDQMHSLEFQSSFPCNSINEPDHFHHKDTNYKDSWADHASMQEDYNDKETDHNQDYVMNLVSNEEKSNITEVDQFPSDQDHVHVASKNDDDSGTGIIIRRRPKKELIKLPFQGTANRRLGAAFGKMRFLNRNHLKDLGSNEETREEVVDRYLVEDTESMEVERVPFNINNQSETARTQNPMPASLPFQGTANRRIRLQRKLQGVPSIKDGEPSNLQTIEETLGEKSSLTEAKMNDQDSSSSKETSFFITVKAAFTVGFCMPKVVVMVGLLCAGIVALWKGPNVL